MIVLFVKDDRSASFIIASSRDIWWIPAKQKFSPRKATRSNAAESVRKKAMERIKDSKKKASQDSGLEPGLAAGGKKSRKSATEVVEFLKEKAKNGSFHFLSAPP